MKNLTVILTSVFVIATLILVSGLALGKILVTNNPAYQEDPLFYKEVANEMVRQGKMDAAVQNYEHSLGLKEDLNIRNNLAVIYYQMQKYPSAITHLRVLVKAVPENPSYHYDLAVNLVDKFRNTDDKRVEDLVEALHEYEAANSLEPGFSNAEGNIAALRKVLKIE